MSDKIVFISIFALGASFFWLYDKLVTLEHASEYEIRSMKSELTDATQKINDDVSQKVLIMEDKLEKLTINLEKVNSENQSIASINGSFESRLSEFILTSNKKLEDLDKNLNEYQSLIDEMKADVNKLDSEILNIRVKTDPISKVTKYENGAIDIQ